jgi:hypothetical protein
LAFCFPAIDLLGISCSTSQSMKLWKNRLTIIAGWWFFIPFYPTFFFLSNREWRWKDV